MNPQQQESFFAKTTRTVRIGLLIIVAVTIATAPSAHAQTFQVIHNFTGGGDGAAPETGLTIDRAGNLYGTASEGGNTAGSCSPNGCGVIFKVSRRGSGWVLIPLYTFRGNTDGAAPSSPVAIGPNGTLYGTTCMGGDTTCNLSSACSSILPGCGAVYNLMPPAHASGNVLGNWNETVLYRFTGSSDGANPAGQLAFDASGNLDGTASDAGSFGGDCGNLGCGTVYQLTRSGSGWTQTVLHTFTEQNDGGEPQGGVVIDSTGSLYGTTTFSSGVGCGTVFQVMPSGSGWTTNILHFFAQDLPSDGCNPIGGVIFDRSGNLYGATPAGYSGVGAGIVYELMNSHDNGWEYSILNALPGNYFEQNGPEASLVMDAAGNLYGTTNSQGAYGYGAVFKLSAPNWTYTSLHDFCAGGLPCSDGAYPRSSLVFDANGNLYGTASSGGATGNGVVFEITP